MSIPSIGNHAGERTSQYERAARNIAIATGVILALGIVLAATHMYTHIPSVVPNLLIGISSPLLTMSLFIYLMSRCQRKKESPPKEPTSEERTSTHIYVLGSNSTSGGYTPTPFVDPRNAPKKESPKPKDWGVGHRLGNQGEVPATQEDAEAALFQAGTTYSAKITALFGEKRATFDRINDVTDTKILNFCESASNYAKPALWGKRAQSEKRICMIRMEKRTLKITADNAETKIAQAYISNDQGKTWREVKDFHPQNGEIIPFVQFIEKWNPKTAEVK